MKNAFSRLDDELVLRSDEMLGNGRVEESYLTLVYIYIYINVIIQNETHLAKVEGKRKFRKMRSAALRARLATRNRSAMNFDVRDPSPI